MKTQVLEQTSYQSYLSYLETEDALELIKSSFPQILSRHLDLRKISAPMVVLKDHRI
jgi:asparagine synthetase A